MPDPNATSRATARWEVLGCAAGAGAGWASPGPASMTSATAVTAKREAERIIRGSSNIAGGLLSDLTEFDKPFFRRQNRPGRQAEEQTVLNHPRNGVESLAERLGPVDAAEMGVDDVMTAIGHERLAA